MRTIISPEICPFCSRSPIIWTTPDIGLHYYQCPECYFCSRPVDISIDPAEYWNKLILIIKKKTTGYTIESKDVLKSMIDNPNTHYCCIHKDGIKLTENFYYYFDDKKGKFIVIDGFGDEFDTNVFLGLETV